MKVKIERIKKIKSFEPFVVNIEIETPEEARELLYEIDNVLDELDDYDKDDKILVKPIKSGIKEELKQQGYIS